MVEVEDLQTCKTSKWLYELEDSCGRWYALVEDAKTHRSVGIVLPKRIEVEIIL